MCIRDSPNALRRLRTWARIFLEKQRMVKPVKSLPITNVLLPECDHSTYFSSQNSYADSEVRYTEREQRSNPLKCKNLGTATQTLTRCISSTRLNTRSPYLWRLYVVFSGWSIKAEIISQRKDQQQIVGTEIQVLQRSMDLMQGWRFALIMRPLIESRWSKLPVTITQIVLIVGLSRIISVVPNILAPANHSVCSIQGKALTKPVSIKILTRFVETRWFFILLWFHDKSRQNPWLFLLGWSPLVMATGPWKDGREGPDLQWANLVNKLLNEGVVATYKA